MILIVALIVAGIILLAAELIVPGGVLGIVGGLLMAAGTVVAYFQLGATGGTATLLVALVALAATLFAEFRVLPRSRVAKAFSMTDTVGGSAPVTLAAPESVVGKECRAVTRLAPTGYVRVGEQQFEAFCRDGMAADGQILRVVGVDNFRLIVTQQQNLS